MISKSTWITRLAKFNYQKKQADNVYLQNSGKKTDRNLEYSTPAWLDDIIAVTRGNMTEHEIRIFLNKTKWLGHKIGEMEIKENTDEVNAILKLKHPETPKQLQSSRCNSKLCKIYIEIVGKIRKTSKTSKERL